MLYLLTWLIRSDYLTWILIAALLCLWQLIAYIRDRFNAARREKMPVKNFVLRVRFLDHLDFWDEFLKRHYHRPQFEGMITVANGNISEAFKRQQFRFLLISRINIYTDICDFYFKQWQRANEATIKNRWIVDQLETRYKDHKALLLQLQEDLRQLDAGQKVNIHD